MDGQQAGERVPVRPVEWPRHSERSAQGLVWPVHEAMTAEQWKGEGVAVTSGRLAGTTSTAEIMTTNPATGVVERAPAVRLYLPSVERFGFGAVAMPWAWGVGPRQVASPWAVFCVFVDVTGDLQESRQAVWVRVCGVLQLNRLWVTNDPATIVSERCGPRQAWQTAFAAAVAYARHGELARRAMLADVKRRKRGAAR